MNTRIFDIEVLKRKENVHYIRVTVKCVTISENDKKILKKLQKPGFLLNPVVSGGEITFSIIEGPQILAKAYKLVVCSLNQYFVSEFISLYGVDYLRRVFNCSATAQNSVNVELHHSCIAK